MFENIYTCMCVCVPLFHEQGYPKWMAKFLPIQTFHNVKLYGAQH